MFSVKFNLEKIKNKNTYCAVIVLSFSEQLQTNFVMLNLTIQINVQVSAYKSEQNILGQCSVYGFVSVHITEVTQDYTECPVKGI